MVHTAKDGRQFLTVTKRAAASPARRAPTVAEQIVLAATRGASGPIEGAEAELLRAQLRNAENDPYNLPPNVGLAAQLRAASANMKSVPTLNGTPDPWRLDEVRR